MKNHVQTGDTLTVTADAEIKSGDLFVAGEIVGFAKADAMEGQLVAIACTGVYECDVNATDDVSLGDVVYAKDGELTTVAADAVRAGVAFADAETDGDTARVLVKLNG